MTMRVACACQQQMRRLGLGLTDVGVVLGSARGLQVDLPGLFTVLAPVRVGDCRCSCPLTV